MTKSKKQVNDFTKKHVSAFVETTCALEPRTTQLFEYDFPNPPAVFYTDEVFAQINYLVQKVGTEVGWLGLVDKLKDNNYLVTKIYIPKQEVSGVETDIDSDAMAELALEIDDDGKDPGKLLYWGHSHVNMGVSPSGQDEVQIEEFISVEPPPKFFIRGIYNKRGQSKVDVYDIQQNCVHQCVNNGLRATALKPADKNFVDEAVKENVTKATTKTQ